MGFRSVKMIAEAAAAPPLILQDRMQRYAEHPLLSTVQSPNPAQGRAELFEALYGQLLTGNTVEAVGGEAGVPVEYTPALGPDEPDPRHDGWLSPDYAVGRRKHRFDVSEGAERLPYQELPSAGRPLWPLAHAGGRDGVDVHNSASRWSKALLDNAARPSGAHRLQGSRGQGALSSDQYDRLVSEMESHHQGARNAGRPMLLEGGLDWKPMGFSPSDMEFQKTKESAAREIALAFGVPPMLLGIPGDATYSNYQEANRAFYRLTVLPLAMRVTAAVADWLSQFAGEALELKPDLDQVPALAAERDAQWARVTAADFLTDAEKRRILGLPALAEDGADG
ncbi:MAG: phage portal protein [Paracoccaceae bacterium]